MDLGRLAPASEVTGGQTLQFWKGQGLLWRYSDATLTLLWRYSDATLTLLWHYSDATLKSDATILYVDSSKVQYVSFNSNFHQTFKVGSLIKEGWLWKSLVPNLSGLFKLIVFVKEIKLKCRFWLFHVATISILYFALDSALLDATLTLLWRYSDATLTLLWRYSDATPTLLWRYSDATLTLLWRYTLTLKSWNRSWWTVHQSPSTALEPSMVCIMCYFGLLRCYLFLPASS
jgi:hypothetical protein